MTRFRARAIFAGEMADIDVFMVVVAENEDGSGKRLELQRADVFDDQDRELGQDTYCISLENGASHYGGVSSWRVSDDALEVDLAPDAAARLGVGDGRFSIALEGAPSAKSALESGLRRVLGEVN